MKKLFYHLSLFLLLAFLLGGCSPKTVPETNTNTNTDIGQQDKPAQPADEFCGRATNAPCEADVDCIAGGCSNQICQNKNEDIFTTCEYSDCYNAEKYGLTCKCSNQECKWSN